MKKKHLRKHLRKYFRSKRWLKNQLIDSRGSKCTYCSKPLSMHQITLDHIVPVTSGGQDTPDNLCISCEPCNKAKADMSEEKFLLLQGLEGG